MELSENRINSLKSSENLEFQLFVYLFIISTYDLLVITAA